MNQFWLAIPRFATKFGVGLTYHTFLGIRTWRVSYFYVIKMTNWASLLLHAGGAWYSFCDFENKSLSAPLKKSAYNLVLREQILLINTHCNTVRSECIIM